MDSNKKDSSGEYAEFTDWDKLKLDVIIINRFILENEEKHQHPYKEEVNTVIKYFFQKYLMKVEVSPPDFLPTP
jgi:hypothetical protein